MRRWAWSVRRLWPVLRVQPSASSQTAPGSSRATAPLTPLNRFGRMVQDYYVRRVRGITGNSDGGTMTISLARLRHAILGALKLPQPRRRT